MDERGMDAFVLFFTLSVMCWPRLDTCTGQDAGEADWTSPLPRFLPGL